MIIFSDIVKNINNSVKSVSDEYLIVLGDVISTAAKKKKKLLIVGNGGSNADAQHIATEMNDQRNFNKPPIRVLTQCSSAQLTSSADNNDLISSTLHFIHSWGDDGDILLILSANQEYANSIKIIEAAQKKKMKTMVIAGADDPVLMAVDYPIEIDSKETHAIQIAGMMVMHYIAENVDRTLYVYDRKMSESMM